LHLIAAAGAMNTVLAVAAPQTGARDNVVFSDYSPLARSAEIARRSFSPLTLDEFTRAAASSGKQIREQPVDLSLESFALYVPAHAPPAGFSLLVFIWPSDAAHVPSAWHQVLDRHGTIMVSASNSGNGQPIWDRRIPLALEGAFNVMQHYAVNSQRVYVGGLSGGSRVAMRLALDYPDLFHGALLNAGSDPIGTASAVLPTKQLLDQLQQESRFVFVTGDMDGVNLEADGSSRRSMNSWCIFGTTAENMFKAGHEALSAAYLDKALTQLEAPWEPNADKLSSCRNHIAEQLGAKLQHASDRLSQGKPHDALQELRQIDLRYGALAAPESLELLQQVSLK
jgi:hypothetical protein